LDEYLGLVRDHARKLFGLDKPPADERGDQRRVATVWSLSLDRVHQEAPAAEALLSLCAFLAPDIPRGLPREQPQVLSEELAQAVNDPLAYNRMVAVVGGYSLATVSPTAVGKRSYNRSMATLAQRRSPCSPRRGLDDRLHQPMQPPTTVGRWRPGQLRAAAATRAGGCRARRAAASGRSVGRLAAGRGVHSSVGAGPVPAGQADRRAGAGDHRGGARSRPSGGWLAVRHARPRAQRAQRPGRCQVALRAGVGNRRGGAWP
jgi:hypothetical protein